MMTDELKKLLDHYNKALGLYRDQKFKEAIIEFKASLKVRPEDGPSKLYIERCEVFMKNPPPKDWDGVFTMTSK